MITVHHLNHSRSQRVLWLLEELGLDYRVERYERGPDYLAPPALRQVHPLGKSPVIVDGDLTLAESGAILDYLVRRYGPHLMPSADSPDFIRYTYWMHYAEGSAMPPLLLKLVFEHIAGAPMPFFAKPVAKGIADKAIGSFIRPQLERQLDYLEHELGASGWFVGDAFSAADIQLSFPLEAAAARAGLDASRPRLTDFLARLHARPAYQRALATGGPYAYA